MRGDTQTPRPRPAAPRGDRARSPPVTLSQLMLAPPECVHPETQAFLANNPSAPSLAGRSVAELGCGHGLPVRRTRAPARSEPWGTSSLFCVVVASGLGQHSAG